MPSHYEIAMSIQMERLLKHERGRPDPYAGPEDMYGEGWPYPDTNGKIEDPAQGRSTHTGDDITLAAVTLRKDESVCGRCHLVHHPDQECP